MTKLAAGKMPDWALPAFSWFVSFYFLSGFVANVGFPPDRSIFSGDALYAFLWLFFLFLPFFRRIKIGSVLELEREIEKTKDELKDFKTEIRNSMSVLSTNVNTIGKMTNQVTVNVPGSSELREARRMVEFEAPPAAKETAAQVENRILVQGDDSALALVKTRIEMERLLRKILGKSTTLQATDEALKFISMRSLFALFLAEYPLYKYLSTPFRYVTQIGNAAIHAQQVSDEQSREALALGAQIIAVLKVVAGEAT